MIGRTISHYSVVEKLGAGGMGEVYRARDAKLGRDVALKVLPEAFARDADRMARFEREAKVLASLSHPQIAAIFGLEDSSGVRALVMELVEGPTLADRIQQGAISWDEALPIARQIAEALEYAHERGIVHRDLKPANIKVSSNDAVKILDFGLAKALEGDPASGDLANSPTLTAAATGAGMLLGTAAYMSPEQARGKRVDRRADIWAFGCVLYEMLGGRRVFSGETISDTLAAVIKEEPNWNALPADIPPAVRVLMRRCLEKDPKRRLQAIGEARIALEGILSGAAQDASALTAAAPISAPTWRRAVPWTLAGAILGGLIAATILWTMRGQPRSPSLAQVRLTIALPAGQLFDNSSTNLAVSADGREIAYVAKNDSGSPQLWLRRLDSFTAKPISGTENALFPFFSPDGQWLGFFSSGKLEKVSIAGGEPQSLCTILNAGGATWAPDGEIYFSVHDVGFGGLMRVAGDGGKCEDVLSPEEMKGKGAFVQPEALPGGQALLATIEKGFSSEEAGIAVISPKAKQWKTILENGTSPRFVPPGYIVFARSGSIWAAPFDQQQLKLTGAPAPIMGGLSRRIFEEEFAVSQNGTLAYVAGTNGPTEREIVELDRKGVARTVTAEKRPYEDLDLSPDGHHLAMTVEGPSWNVWTYDLLRGTLERLTFENDNRDPFWSYGGKKIAYTSLRGGEYGLYTKSADGSGAEEKIYGSSSWIFATSFSPDGRNLAFDWEDPSYGMAMWILPLGGTGKEHAIWQGSAGGWFPTFSPDGHWVAYESGESGREEIYVQSFPGPGGKWQISNGGGVRPVWPRNGNEIFYMNGNKLMAVPVQTRPAFSPGTPHELFEGDFFASGHYYDASAHGQHFFFIKDVSQASSPTQINVVLNWESEVARLVARGRK